MKALGWVGRFRGTLLGGVLLLPSLTCGGHAVPTRTATPLPLYITPLIPPAEYERWYHQAERCAGMKGNYAAVRWMVTPTPWGDTTYGWWNITRDSAGFVQKVEILVNARMGRDSLLIVHESLHDILWRNGWSAPTLHAGATRRDSLINLHPQPFFHLSGPLGVCPAVFYPWPKEPEPEYRP